MKGAQRKRRHGTWFVTAMAITILAGIFVFRFVAPRVQNRLESRVLRTIASQLGSDARVGSVELTWRSLVLNNVTIPIDGAGTTLWIKQIKADLHPMQLPRKAYKYEQIVSSVHITAPDLLLRTSMQSRAKQTDESWLPHFTLPPRLFSLFGQFAELSKVDIERGCVRSIAASADTTTWCEYDGVIERESGGFRLAVNGRLLNDSASILSVTGALSEAKRSLDLQAIFRVLLDPRNNAFARKVGLKVEGDMAIRLSVTESDINYSGSAAVSNAGISVGKALLRIPEIRASLHNDTVRVDSFEFSTSYAQGEIGGVVLLRGAGELNFAGRLHADDLNRLKESWPRVTQIEGGVDVVYTIKGSVTEPLCEAQLHGDRLRVLNHELQEIRADLLITPANLDVCSLQFTTLNSRIAASGNLVFAPTLSWNGNGEWTYRTVPTILGWKLGVQRVRFTGSGARDIPDFSVVAMDTNGFELCRGVVSWNNGQWVLDAQSPGSGSSRLEVEPFPDHLKFTVKNAHYLVGAVVPDLQSAATILRQLDVQFSGGTEEGDITCNARAGLDTTALWTRIARELHFSGKYDHSAGSGYIFSGKWSGEAGNGDPFEGQAELTLADRLLIIKQVFIDAVGRLNGNVDMNTRQLDLELTVEDLSLSKLPIPPAVLERSEIRGTLAGHVRAQGPLDNPKWSAGFAMTDGSVFGVPGYWMNLEASGNGLSTQIQSYELGRGVRKIIRAEGEIDGKTGRLNLTARVGAARAEDFFLALTGKRGVISGEMDGWGTVKGTFSDPEVEADVAIRDGELFDEIYMDEFDAAFQMVRNAEGERQVRISRCNFSKLGVYNFGGTAEMFPRAGGPLQAHIEGRGDFLDILDQMDRSFRTEGSTGNLDLDFGGTVDHPRFLGGKLRVDKGRFVYPEATPGVIATEIDIRIDTAGTVDTGFVTFHSDNQWIEIRSRPGCMPGSDSLIPLVIRTPRICLGVLEIRTGTSGMPLRLPGLMKPEWTGVFFAGFDGNQPITISSIRDDRLKFDGGIVVRNARVTYPFARGGSGPMRKVARWLVNRLKEADWNLDVFVGTGNHYDVEITGLKDSEMFAPLRGSPVFETIASYLDHLSIDAILDPSDTPLQIRGTIDDNSFHLNGRTASTRGKVDYLDQSFQIEYLYSDFDETDVMPILEGRAQTIGQDSLGRDVPVYLTMYQIDRETNTRQERGRLNNITYVLEGDGGETPEQILQYLGYDIQDMTGKAGQLVASTVVRAIGRRWLDPLERRLERWTMLDEIAFTPGRGRSVSAARAQRVAAQTDTLQQNSAVRFFTGSQFTVGKYLTRDLFLTYTGELAEGQIELGSRLGFIHVWNLEYRINPMSRDLVLDFAVEYDELERKRDESVSLKYTFALEP